MNEFVEPDPQALPTAKPFLGRTVVMRVDEQAIESATLVADVVFMRRLGVRPVIVHDVSQRSSGSRLVGLINRIGGEAVALDGTSASTLVLTQDDLGRNIVRSVNPTLLSLLLEQGYIPVFSSEGASVSGACAPLDAAEAAGVLAAATHAVRLLYSSGTGGICSADAGVIEELTSSEALALAAAGTLSADQSNQLTAAAMGVRCGVDAAQLLDLSTAHAALVEMLTAQHLGTQIVSHIVLSS